MYFEAKKKIGLYLVKSICIDLLLAVVFLCRLHLLKKKLSVVLKKGAQVTFACEENIVGIAFRCCQTMELQSRNFAPAKVAKNSSQLFTCSQKRTHDYPTARCPKRLGWCWKKFTPKKRIWKDQNFAKDNDFMRWQVTLTFIKRTGISQTSFVLLELTETNTHRKFSDRPTRSQLWRWYCQTLDAIGQQRRSK